MATLSPLEQQFADQQKKKRQNSSKSPLHDARPVNATGLPHPTLGGTPNPNVSGRPMNQGGQTLPQGFVPGPGKGTNKTFTTSNVPAGGRVQEQIGAGGGTVQEEMAQIQPVLGRSLGVGDLGEDARESLRQQVWNNMSHLEQQAQREAEARLQEKYGHLSPLELKAMFDGGGGDISHTALSPIEQ